MSSSIVTLLLSDNIILSLEKAAEEKGTTLNKEALEALEKHCFKKKSDRKTDSN